MLRSHRDWRLGAVANLTPGGSVHRAAFERGIEYGLRDSKGDLSITLIAENDQASAGAARAAAQRLVAADVDLVIGHFSSEAACAAASIYAQAGIPLLLPAATRVDLTGHRTTYRLCGNDYQFAQAIVTEVVDRLHVGYLEVETDCSAHAQLVKEYVEDLFCDRREHAKSPKALLFIGHFNAAIKFLHGRSRDWPHYVLLSDDCMHEALAHHVPEGCRLYVFGFEPLSMLVRGTSLRQRLRQEGKSEAVIYFAETYAAAEVATALFRRAEEPPHQSLPLLLPQEQWQTIIGPIRFANRENPSARFAVWEATRSGLRPLRPLVVPTELSGNCPPAAAGHEP